MGSARPGTPSPLLCLSTAAGASSPTCLGLYLHNDHAQMASKFVASLWPHAAANTSAMAEHVRDGWHSGLPVEAHIRLLIHATLLALGR